MEPFVAEMWRRQTPTEWFNYDALHNAFEKTAQKAPPSQKHERRIHSQVRGRGEEEEKIKDMALHILQVHDTRERVHA